MAKKEVATKKQTPAQDIERLKQHLDILDHRLDNIDSMVSAIAERVMKQPISLFTTCPHCGKNIEIGVLGSEKPTK